MSLLRAAARLAGDLVAYGRWTGRWWLPIVTAVFALSVLLALTAKTVVAPALYVFF